MGDQAWPKSARLRRRREFLDVQARGLKAQGQWLTALARPSRAGRLRLGVTVSTKVGNSVARSQVKRWIREAFRKNRSALPPAIDVVLIARPGADASGYEALVKDLLKVARALHAKLKPATNKLSPGSPP